MGDLKQDTYKFTFKPNRTSQLGRLLAYIKREGNEESKMYVVSALKDHYLVQALIEEGVREREDLNAIAARCCARLRKQIEDIETLMGIQYEEGHSFRPQFKKSNQLLIGEEEANFSQPTTSESSSDEDEDEEDEDEEENNMPSFYDDQSLENAEAATDKEIDALIDSAFE